MKKALITGITGQDGSYLAEQLLDAGYTVHGLVRRSSTMNRSRIDHLRRHNESGTPRLILHYGDVADSGLLFKLVAETRPNEIYNLAAQSHVRVSFDEPIHTVNTVATSTVSLLEAIKTVDREIRFYQASTSELFGDSPAPQTESTPFRPRSPYAYAKLLSYWATVNYRDSYGIYAVNGILFNHESPRRGETFLTRKVSIGVAEILSGSRRELKLGNLDARRDWGFAPEYTQAMHLMLQQDAPRDVVLATGRSIAVQDFVEMAFSSVGLDWREYVSIDEHLFRPTEVPDLCGDATVAKQWLNWQPRTTVEQLAELMVQEDVRRSHG